MKKLIFKSILYVFLIIIALEVYVRIFHLYTEVPVRYIDKFGVEKSVSNQTGYAVTGNRRQNHSEYHINDFGFNSYREFTPSENKIEVAIIGDSFIEGMHQDYYNSTGKKVENKLNDVEVYEYGYAGYDLANQMYLLEAYKEDFDKIDHIIFYIKYENDFDNAIYKPNHERIALLKSPLFKVRDKFKLLSYASSIGIVDPIKDFAIRIINRGKKTANHEQRVEQIDEDPIKIKNFKVLLETYGFNKSKMSFLLDSSTTSQKFLDYCKSNNYDLIDFHQVFKNSTKPTTLIYDMHWNDHGRELISQEIASYLKKKLNLQNRIK